MSRRMKCGKPSLARLSAISSAWLSGHNPKDILVGDEAWRVIDRQDGASKRACRGPSVLPERPIEYFEPGVASGRTQACDQRAGLGTVRRVTTVAAFREQGPPGAAEALDTLSDRVVHRGEH